jgi:hypothetical protein
MDRQGAQAITFANRERVGAVGHQGDDPQGLRQRNRRNEPVPRGSVSTGASPDSTVKNRESARSVNAATGIV